VKKGYRFLCVHDWKTRRFAKTLAEAIFYRQFDVDERRKQKEMSASLWTAVCEQYGMDGALDLPSIAVLSRFVLMLILYYRSLKFFHV